MKYATAIGPPWPDAPPIRPISAPKIPLIKMVRRPLYAHPLRSNVAIAIVPKATSRRRVTTSVTARINTPRGIATLHAARNGISSLHWAIGAARTTSDICPSETAIIVTATAWAGSRRWLITGTIISAPPNPEYPCNSPAANAIQPAVKSTDRSGKLPIACMRVSPAILMLVSMERSGNRNYTLHGP